MNNYQLDIECDLALKRVMAKVDEMIADYYNPYSVINILKFARKYGLYINSSGFNIKFNHA